VDEREQRVGGMRNSPFRRRNLAWKERKKDALSLEVFTARLDGALSN